MVAQGFLLGGLSMTGCSGTPAEDPEIAKAVHSRIKRIADSNDDQAPSGKIKGKSVSKGAARSGAK
ncbi:MAG: hypothetical protein ABS79_06715 [Planctomycetes bacterium SCN 63-9]|nr:MAG: hypothetical protein ABS79_06715 [Planctomycetes bacterium SCN 63-9]